MKGERIMERSLLGIKIRQNHKTGMINATDLDKAGNKQRIMDGLAPRDLSAYWRKDDTAKLIEELMRLDNRELKELKQTKGGKNGGTWIAPELFVDLAMWYSPEIKAKVLKWIVDGLLLSRDMSGDSFKAMNNELKKNFQEECENPVTYIRVANSIASACKVGTGKSKWETATEEQLRLRDKIQDTAALIADMCPDVTTTIITAINKVIK